MAQITMRNMLEAGVHFGHRKRDWNPKMSEFIYGIHYQVHIINLEKTLPLFKDALNFVSHLAGKRGKILFVGTKYAARDAIKEEATRCGMPYVNHRWLGGMLTNYKTIRQLIKRYKDLVANIESGVFEGLTKKEKLHIMREKDKLEQSIGGIKDMGSLPDALFVIDVGHEKIAIDEALKLGIPVIGVVDTNNNPERIDYIIPGNDDSVRAIHLYTKAMADVILDAKSSHAVEERIEEKETKIEEKAKRKVVTKKMPLREEKSEASESQDVEAKKSGKVKKETSASKSKEKTGGDRTLSKKPSTNEKTTIKTQPKKMVIEDEVNQASDKTVSHEES